MKKCAFVVVRKRTGIGRSVRVIRGNSMDVIFHLTRCPLGKESVGKRAVVGETDEKAKFVRHSKQEDRRARLRALSACVSSCMSRESNCYLHSRPSN